MTRAERLHEGYYALRLEAPALRRRSGLYEGQPWITVGKTERRDGTDGSELLVYEIEGAPEVCIIDADGQSTTYA